MRVLLFTTRLLSEHNESMPCAGLTGATGFEVCKKLKQDPTTRDIPTADVVVRELVLLSPRPAADLAAD